MKFEIRSDVKEMDIDKLSQLYERSSIGTRDRDRLKLAFSKAHQAVAIESDGQYIAAGRTISDGKYTFVIELVVLSEFKNQGFGKLVLEELLKGEEKNFVYLNSTFEAERFYQKLGFRKQKTGYAKYPFESEYLEPNENHPS